MSALLYAAGMDKIDIVEAQWPYVLAMMPADLEQTALSKLALARRREIGSAGDLLRLALLYGFCDLSLRQTAVRASLLGLGELSDVAVLHRLEKAADWLGHLLVQFLQERGLAHRVPPLAVQVVDATTVSRPGSRGTDWGGARRWRGTRLRRARCCLGIEATRTGREWPGCWRQAAMWWCG